MRRFFTDAAYFIALANPKDQRHRTAVEFFESAVDAAIVTTEDVLVEWLNFYAESGEFMRQKVIGLVRSVLLDPKIKVLPRSETTFVEALELYESRLDKGYSLTDCISMNACREFGIEEILTSDRHFVQEGFKILLQS